MTKIKTNRSILRSNAVRGCWSCRSLSRQDHRKLETLRIVVARSTFISRQTV